MGLQLSPAPPNLDKTMQLCDEVWMCMLGDSPALLELQDREDGLLCWMDLADALYSTLPLPATDDSGVKKMTAQEAFEKAFCAGCEVLYVMESDGKVASYKVPDIAFD